jgi:hypothetical protein
MKRDLLSLIALLFLVLFLGSWSWANCPQDTSDHGNCDSLNVNCMDCNQPDTGSYYLIRFPMLVTHDVVDQSIDSLAGITIPLCYSHTNPTKYCSLSTYWNTTTFSGGSSARSIFRDLVRVPGDTIFNWMMDLYQQDPAVQWANLILYMKTGGTNPDSMNYWWLALAPTTQPLMGDVNRALIATMTFRVQDTMHVSIDSCYWPPQSNLAFSRNDSKLYVPRVNLPHTFWIGPPLIQVTLPNGGERWAVGSTKNITWTSDNLGANVKIDYSINSGSTWLSVIGSTSNTGSYPWIIPNNQSTHCRVKVSDISGAPYDSSDADFWIVQPDFTIKATPDTQTIQAGHSTDYSVILDSLFGFTSPCTLTVAGLPAGASPSFNPSRVIPPDTSVMTISTTAGTSLPGTYQLIITATQLSKALIQHKDTVFLKVTPPPDFTIDADPDTQTVNRGQSTTYNVTMTPLNGFTSPCSLFVSGLPVGASAGFTPNPVSNPPGTSIMTVNTLGTIIAGKYDLTITGREIGGAHFQHDTHVFLKVSDFTIKASPETLSVSQGNQGSYEVILTSMYGFNSSCMLTVSGLPQDASGSFTPDTLVPTDTSMLTIAVAQTTPLGIYQIIISAPVLPPGKIIIPHSDTVYLEVRGPGDFSISVLPETLHVSLGTDSSYSVTLTSLNGYSSPCTLTVAGMPTGVEGSFESPLVTPTGSTKLNIEVSCTAQTTPITPHTLTVTATEKGGTLHHSKNIKLYVDPGTWNFILDTSPDTQNVVAGDSATYKIIMQRHTCFTLPCTLSIESGLPSGATYHFSPTIIPPNDTFSVLTVSTLGCPDTLAGIFKLKIKAMANTKPVRDSVSLVVQNFKIAVTPDTAYVTRGQSVGYNIGVNSLFGFSEPCTLFISGLPDPPDSGVFDKPTVIPSDVAALNVFTTTQTNTIWYTLTITAQRMTAKSNGLQHSFQVKLKVNESSDVEDGSDNPNAPKTFTLFQNQPNPFNPETRISYYLPKACQVKLTIYNVLGQTVRTLYDGYQNAGIQTLTWDSRGEDGAELSSGIYFYRLQAGDFNQTKKMSLMK